MSALTNNFPTIISLTHLRQKPILSTKITII